MFRTCFPQEKTERPQSPFPGENVTCGRAVLPSRIIPIFLIHRPENNIPYATVEEELIGEFVKYSIRDGKEINFLRRDSEAGQKCCTFQHWVYQKTSGCLLVTDMQGEESSLTWLAGVQRAWNVPGGVDGGRGGGLADAFKHLYQQEVLLMSHQKQA